MSLLDITNRFVAGEILPHTALNTLFNDIKNSLDKDDTSGGLDNSDFAAQGIKANNIGYGVFDENHLALLSILNSHIADKQVTREKFAGVLGWEKLYTNGGLGGSDDDYVHMLVAPNWSGANTSDLVIIGGAQEKYLNNDRTTWDITFATDNQLGGDPSFEDVSNMTIFANILWDNPSWGWASVAANQFLTRPMLLSKSTAGCSFYVYKTGEEWFTSILVKLVWLAIGRRTL